MSTKRDSLWLMGRISPGMQHLHLPLFVRQPETLKKKKGVVKIKINKLVLAGRAKKSFL